MSVRIRSILLITIYTLGSPLCFQKVQLRDDLDFYRCGGGIIGSEWIITGGSCVGQIATVIYGTNKLYDYFNGTPNTSIKVKNRFEHPNFTYFIDDIPIYDVGILQLEEQIPFSATAQPIKLVEADATIPFHIQGVLSGWGANATYAARSPYLQKINLELLTDQECSEKINDFKVIHHLCTDDYYSGECYGDSGSPYVVNGTAYGLSASGAQSCGVLPGAYSRISNPEYRNWIKNVTGI